MEGNLCSNVTEIICSKLNIKLLHGRPYHPQSQGQVENLNRRMKRAFVSLKKIRRKFGHHFWMMSHSFWTMQGQAPNRWEAERRLYSNPGDKLPFAWWKQMYTEGSSIQCWRSRCHSMLFCWTEKRFPCLIMKALRGKGLGSHLWGFGWKLVKLHKVDRKVSTWKGHHWSYQRWQWPKLVESSKCLSVLTKLNGVVKGVEK